MARNTEPQMNGALARALRRRHPLWNDETVHAEQTRVLKNARKQPDILVEIENRQPVAIEAEVEPAANVEDEARERLGKPLGSTGARIESAIAVIYPKRFRDGALDAAIESAADLRYAAFHELENGDSKRWPKSGWIETDVNGLADAIEHLSLSERKLAQGTRALEEIVQQTANRIKSWSGENSIAFKRIAEELHQKPGEQTNRMAAAIFVSAFMFHAAIEGLEQKQKLTVDGKKTTFTRVVPKLPEGVGELNKIALLELWRIILKIDYKPIFDIARDLLRCLPDRAVHKVMERVRDGVSELTDLGVGTYHDLAGKMFQKLIADRKFLATFYTLPESARLLAELAVRRLKVDWSDADAIKKLKIADFACGTGALLSATQQAIYNRHRRAGGDDKELQTAMMEEVLFGMDIMPAAAHLTCSMLSSAHPSAWYQWSQIHTMPYGSGSFGKGKIGSLDLLGAEEIKDLFDTGIQRMSSADEVADSAPDIEKRVVLGDKSCDLVIMNPPFVRPTGQESGKIGVPVPSFAGFNTSEDEQRAMSKELKAKYALLARNGNGDAVFAGHGNAGLASNFMDLAHAKLKPGGTLALVLPFTFVQGASWSAARKLLETHYRDIAIVSIATAGANEQAFSADTGIAEVLIVATRNGKNQAPAPQADVQFVNLKRRPFTQLEAVAVANRIDNPEFQSESGGRISAPLALGGCAGIQSESLARAMMGLFQSGAVALPRTQAKMNFKLVKLGEIGDRGAHVLDITGQPHGKDKKPRGPFSKSGLHKDNPPPEFPYLWNHDAERERRLIVEIDGQGIVREGCRERAINLWEAIASRLHITVDFTLSSQSLTACLTPEKSIGGMAWPNFILSDKEWDIPAVLWLNTTLGLMSFWWIGTRQQLGRARLPVSQHPELPTLDPRKLNKRQLAQAQDIFDKFKGREFLPANEAYRDETRQALDKAILVDLLKQPAELLEPLDLLRRQWCAEPSVHGGKRTRPRDRNAAHREFADYVLKNYTRDDINELDKSKVSEILTDKYGDLASGRISAPLAMGGCAGMLSDSIAKAMMGLFQSGSVAFSRTKSEMKFELANLGELGNRGAHILDITGKPYGKDNMPRGPFSKAEWNKGAAPPDYPALWNHDSERERRLIVEIDGQGIAREGCRERAIDLWNTIASRLHINVEFGLSAGSLAACLTPEKTIGGRAWPNFILDDTEWEAPTVLWLNTTLGIMSFWWIGTRQQSGRAMLPVSQHPELPTLDPRKLTKRQLAQAQDIFDKFKGREFLPANEAYRDETRQALDKALLVDLLKLPAELLEPLDLLRRQWCAEPSVHGGKSTRPTN